MSGLWKTGVQLAVFTGAVVASGAAIFPTSSEVTERLLARGQLEVAIPRLRQQVTTNEEQDPHTLLRASEVLRDYGDRATAMAGFAKLIELEVRAPGHWLTLADLYRERQEPEREIHALEQVLKQVPGHPGALRRLVQAYRLEQRPLLLISALTRCAAALPEQDGSDLRELARLELGRGDAAAGTRWLEAYLTKKPQDAEAWNLRIDLADLAGAGSLAALLADRKQDPRLVLLAADTLEAQRRLAGAAALVEAALLLHPVHLGLLRRALDLRETLKAWPEAITHAERLVRLGPKDPLRLLRLAELYQANKEPAKAIAALRQARALQPKNAALLERLAALLMDVDPRLAIEVYQDLARLKPGDPKAHARLLGAAEAAGEYALLAELLETALKKDPENTALARRLAEVQLWRADLPAAIAAWRRLWLLDRSDLAVLRKLIEVTSWSGDSASERGLLETLLERDGADGGAAQRLAELFTFSRPTESGWALLERFLVRFPESHGVQGFLATSYADHGRPELAVAHLRAMSRQAPGDLKLRRQYIETLHKAGLKQEAQAEVKKLVGAEELSWVRLGAKLALETDELDLAFTGHQRLAEADPTDIDSIELCGRIAVWRSRHALAKPYLQAALAARPEAGVLHAMLANVLENLSPTNPRRLRHYKAAYRLLASEPGDEEQLFFARAASKLGYHSRALSAYRALTTRLPKDDTVQLGYARTLAHLKRIPAARLAARKVQLRKPKDLALLATLAEIEVLAGRLEEGLKLYSRVAKDPRADLGPLLDYANLLKQLGRDAEASRIYRRVLEKQKAHKKKAP